MQQTANTMSNMSRIQQGYSAYLTSMKTNSNPGALSSHISSAIKPSVCFLNLPREAHKIVGKPPDMMDGPSPLQKLGNDVTLRDKLNKTNFENEREQHEGVKDAKIGCLSEARPPSRPPVRLRFLFIHSFSPSGLHSGPAHPSDARIWLCTDLLVRPRDTSRST